LMYIYGFKKALRPIDMNHYATKKRAAQSMLDVALLMANSSQLKTILYVGPQYRFYVPLIMLLTLSSALQVIVGLLLVFIGNCASLCVIPLGTGPSHKRSAAPERFCRHPLLSAWQRAHLPGA
uniref:Ninjurin 1 n=1 Tax=Maylandia zebra TaxID=106582 RepID=A0A3P9DMS4_9CICH